MDEKSIPPGTLLIMRLASEFWRALKPNTTIGEATEAVAAARARLAEMEAWGKTDWQEARNLAHMRRVVYACDYNVETDPERRDFRAALAKLHMLRNLLEADDPSRGDVSALYNYVAAQQNWVEPQTVPSAKMRLETFKTKELTTARWQLEQAERTLRDVQQAWADYHADQERVAMLARHLGIED